MLWRSRPKEEKEETKGKVGGGEIAAVVASGEISMVGVIEEVGGLCLGAGLVRGADSQHYTARARPLWMENSAKSVKVGVSTP